MRDSCWSQRPLWHLDRGLPGLVLIVINSRTELNFLLVISLSWNWRSLVLDDSEGKLRWVRFSCHVWLGATESQRFLAVWNKTTGFVRQLHEFHELHEAHIEPHHKYALVSVCWDGYRQSFILLLILTFIYFSVNGSHNVFRSPYKTYAYFVSDYILQRNWN